MADNRHYLPDTNTLLRYLLKDHQEFSIRAAAFWESVRIGETEALLTEGVLMECVYVLQRFYKVPRAKISNELKLVLAYKGLEYDEIFDSALGIYGERNIDFVDCVLVARQDAGLGKVFSFDKDIA